MSLLVKTILSGSLNGRNIAVVATSTPGTGLHFTAGLSRVRLEACNIDTVARKLTIECGGASSPDDLVEVTIPPKAGWFPVLDGWYSQGLAISAFAAVASAINVRGETDLVDL